MAARYRTPRESIAPLPSSFPRLPRTNSHGTQSGPSTPVATPPSTTQQSTAQKPLLKSHTRNKARDATSCHVDPAVRRTSCQPFGRHTVQSIDRTERSKTGTQSRTLHAHSPFDAAAAATGTVPERRMTSSKKGLAKENQSTRPYAKRHSGCCNCRVRGQKCALLNPASYVSLPSHQCSA
ncbi:hypothetical protein TcCL_Unassigned04879 [Trypanosoma cruzi]|nr:hypothetical protein TcCL_Unassigned04879 [Trypanosoma cruzi]